MAKPTTTPGTTRTGTPTGAAPRAPHLGPARRREPVLDAALTIFAEGGFSAASMAAIAVGAGVSKAVLYDCFPGGKEELWCALLDREEERFARHLAGVLSGDDQRPLDQALSAGFAAFLEYAELNPSTFRIIFGGAGTASPELRRRVEQVRERLIATMRDVTVARLALPAPAAPGAELFVRLVVASAEELARWTLRGTDLPRPVMAQLAANWLTHGVLSTIAVVAPGTSGE